MNKKEIKCILERVAKGDISADDAVLALKAAPFTDLGFAKLDNHRALRQGQNEVIYGEGKTASQIIKIVSAMLQNGEKRILITRLAADAAEEIKSRVPITYYEIGRIGYIGEKPAPDTEGKLLVISAGTADMPIAEEAALTAEIYGNKVTRIYDAGVSGLHRLLSYLDEIMSADVIIAVAGMEGALASVVGGLADCPVIAVPTSVGYGASFGGVAALLSMLNSCASGVCAVNIDNGFGAGYVASMVNHKKSK
ncbi:MAG: nickel pincer cofactor biosynthesis protein LarB [Eubacteriales bacterium]|nr:nickel pincer cofactor biosynthesis protein LarB [Eubacteriales bacterium]